MMLLLLHSWRQTYGSGVSGFFEDLPGCLDFLVLLAAFQGANLLLQPHTQTLHHLYTQDTTCIKETFLMVTTSHTHLLSRAGDQSLMQPESLFLGETLSLVVPKQSTLDLSHTHTDDRCLCSSVCRRHKASSFAW